jgi:ubiquinone/menaquinone biosynthesis C-methylase UbiE
MSDQEKKSQFMHPRGFAGRVIFLGMNIGHRSIYQNTARALALRPDDDLLDVGCGNGHFIKKYASHVHSVTGVDLANLSVELATRKNKSRVAAGTAEFARCDVVNLPCEDNKFSVVTSMGSFIGFPQPLESLKEMYRVLRHGGRVIISIEYSAEDGKDRTKEAEKYGMWIWTTDEVIKLLEDAGFADVSISYASGLGMPKMMLACGTKP